MSEIRYWDRKLGREETELVYGDSGVNFLYGNRFGRAFTDAVFSKHLTSLFAGIYQNTAFSRKKIEPFIEKFKIPMKEFEPQDFRSFNEFFIRKFKPGARSFASAPRALAAFAEARYLAYEKILPEQKFPVKGEDLSAADLLGQPGMASDFEGGPLLLARLCPVDYHRFHYPDDGRTLDSYRIHGGLHSVNPMALQHRSEIFVTNERQVSLLETRHFGKLAYIEVGALAVGRIVQTHLQPEFKRGEEKGYFLFGASTVIVLGEPGAWKPAADLLEQTALQRETLVRLGEPLTDPN